MSHVTDSFLMTSVDFDPDYSEDDVAEFKKIDDWCDEHVGSQRFKRLDDNTKAYGGGKVFQATIWCGAFNYLDINAFVAFIKTLDFHGWAQFIYQDEHDSGFTLVQISDDSDDF